MSDLVVVDQEYHEFKRALGHFADVAEEQWTSYVNILTTICDSILTEGAAAFNLRAFTEHIATMQGSIREQVRFMEVSCDGFLQEIDQADEWIYD